MPTYDYKCKACGKSFSIFQGMKEGKKRKCPFCGELALVRLVGSGGGVIFKGKGWPDIERRRAELEDKRRGRSNDTGL